MTYQELRENYKFLRKLYAELPEELRCQQTGVDLISKMRELDFDMRRIKNAIPRRCTINTNYYAPLFQLVSNVWNSEKFITVYFALLAIFYLIIITSIT